MKRNYSLDEIMDVWIALMKEGPVKIHLTRHELKERLRLLERLNKTIKRLSKGDMQC